MNMKDLAANENAPIIAHYKGAMVCAKAEYLNELKL